MQVLQRVKAFLSSFRVDPAVQSSAYHQPGKDLKVAPIDAAACERCACALEAALVMTDSMNPEQVITIEVTRMELSSFVCYMRELDKQYRLLSLRTELDKHPTAKLK
jgi:hypothetical protein